MVWQQQQGSRDGCNKKQGRVKCDAAGSGKCNCFVLRSCPGWAMANRELRNSLGNSFCEDGGLADSHGMLFKIRTSRKSNG